MSASSIAPALAAGLIPVAAVYLFYRRHFQVKSDFLGHLEFFFHGVLLACILFTAGLFFRGLIPPGNALIRGFVQAALVEKTGALVVIGILICRKKHDFSVMNGIVSAMFLGLGFAALENIIYALSRDSSILPVRLISSVPLHILSCGLMGYFLSMVKLSKSAVNRAAGVIAGFGAPLLLHGAYDSLLYRGGTMPYYVPLILVFLIVLMEYLLARSQVFPSGDELREKGLAIEDWRSIDREPQFERWILRSLGTRNTDHVPFFALHVTPAKWAIIGALALTAAAFAVMKSRAPIIPATVTPVEATMLFILLPGLYAFNLLAVGLINPEYFKKSIIRIPIIIDAVINIEVDSPDKDDVVDTVTYHVTGQNSFFKTPAPLAPGSPVKCILYCSRFSSPVLEGVVALDRHGGDDEFNGTLVRFTSRPPGFGLFLLRYHLYRLSRGLAYNLNLPGSRDIRRLFIRPVSVMEQEYTFPSGHEVFRQGERGNEFYLIRKGKINIMKKLPRGGQVLLTTMGRGDIFGEMAILGNQTRLATAVCSGQCVLAVARADNLDALIEHNPEFARKLLETLARRHHDSERNYLNIIGRMKSTTGKTNTLLLSLVKMTLACSGGDSAGNNFNYDLLAQKIRCDRETAVKIVEMISSCRDGSDLEELIDRETAGAIITAFREYPLAVRGDAKK
ncbi:MAG: cyclic nucleotide-binding domain-containing protein [Spirochaetes bacterium]|nr:cyclic nucleotide-binding domain-containing protein [Spirochaetota bacterium]